MVECLPNKLKALGSILNTKKGKKKDNSPVSDSQIGAATPLPSCFPPSLSAQDGPGKDLSIDKEEKGLPRAATGHPFLKDDFERCGIPTQVTYL